MTYYAIRHIPTGHFLPATARRRGFTYDEPSHPGLFPPRMFTSLGAAKVALTWWLKGHTSVHRSGSSDWGDDYDEYWHTEAKVERRREDMEVVALALQEIEGPFVTPDTVDADLWRTLMGSERVRIVESNHNPNNLDEPIRDPNDFRFTISFGGPPSGSIYELQDTAGLLHAFAMAIKMDRHGETRSNEYDSINGGSPPENS